MKQIAAFVMMLFSCAVLFAAEAGGRAVLLPLEGTVDKGMVMLARRGIREIRSEKPDAVVIKLNTPGGGIEETKEIIAWLRTLRQEGIPVYAWVHTDALSAGAMLAMACDRIYMSPGATIGAAMPIALTPQNEIMDLPEDVQEKMLSAVRAMVSGLAEENGYRREIAVAMVDRNHPPIAFADRDGKKYECPAGTLLSMNDTEAAFIPKEETRPLLSSGNADTPEELLVMAGVKAPEVIAIQVTAADRLAKWIIMLSPLMLSLGMLLIFKEIMTPGFGIFGILGISLVAVNFFGHYVAGLAGMEEFVLLAAGFILLALEVFVIPGFGICGILGIIALLAGILMAFIPALPEAAPLDGLTLPTVGDMLPAAIAKVVVVIAICAAGIFLMIKYLPHLPFLRGLVLVKDLGHGNGNSDEELDARRLLVGQCGTAVTDLRPCGTANIQDRNYDVLTQGPYIRRGTRIQVVGQNGTAVTVKALENAAEDNAG